MHNPCMATTTISINQEAYSRLKRLKKPGESFSDVILNHLYVPAETGEELLERLEEIHPPIVDHELMKQVRAGCGRRSNRTPCHAA